MPQLDFLCHQRNVDEFNDLPMNCNGCRFGVWCCYHNWDFDDSFNVLDQRELHGQVTWNAPRK